jgi:2-keto-3-deoxy-L-rhamnonate aldolase RhmA
MIQSVLRAGKACGTPVGIYAMGLEDAIRRAEQGFQFMPIVNDLSCYQQGASEAVSGWAAR